VANLNVNLNQGGGDEKGVDAVHAGDEGKRDLKMGASIPVIALCGMGLGGILMGIFILEAFVGEVYDGFGKEVVVSPPSFTLSLFRPYFIHGTVPVKHQANI